MFISKCVPYILFRLITDDNQCITWNDDGSVEIVAIDSLAAGSDEDNQVSEDISDALKEENLDENQICNYLVSLCSWVDWDHDTNCWWDERWYIHGENVVNFRKCWFLTRFLKYMYWVHFYFGKTKTTRCIRCISLHVFSIRGTRLHLDTFKFTVLTPSP